MSVYLARRGERRGSRRRRARARSRRRRSPAIEFVSKEEALVRFKQTFADLATTVSSLEANPLPASYEVRFQPGAGGSASADALASKLRLTPGRDRRPVRPAMARPPAVGRRHDARGRRSSSATVLIVAAALTVATVVRLALHARRDEIEIMQLVGAPQAYVRGPFVMEGVLQGGVGAAVALAALAVAFFAAQAALPDPARRGGQPLVRAVSCPSGSAWSCWPGGWWSAASAGCWRAVEPDRRNRKNLVTES